MKIKDHLQYKKIEYLSNVYDKSFSMVLKSKRIESQPPLFIFGSGRNGSTLISSILNNHSRIFIPPENSIIPFAIKYWYLNPMKSSEMKIERIISELEKPSMWNLDLSKLRLKLKSIPKNNKNVAIVLDCIYREYANKYKQSSDIIWGDKTPSNTLYSYLIKKQFDNSRILMLLRDPRAVMSSLLRVNYEYYLKRLDHMIWRWNCSLKKYKDLLQQNPNSIKLLKYEDFVSSPQSSLEDLLIWLDVKIEDGMLNNKAKNMSLLGVVEARHHQNLRIGIGQTNIDKWKTNLSTKVILHIEKKTKNGMELYNYK